MKSRLYLEFGRLWRHAIACSMITLLAISSLGSGTATALEYDLVSRDAASRAGLTPHWFTFVRVNPAYGGIAHITQHINDRDTTTVFEITGGLRKEVFSEHDLDAFGEPVGIEGAEAAANTRLEVLQAEGWDAKVEKLVKPKITFYVMTESSILQALDGETGATRWTARIGTGNNAAQPAAATDDLVVAVNGSTVYFLDADTGFVQWTRETKGATGAGVVISNRYAFVPLLIGQMQAYPLRSETAADVLFTTVGRNFIMPTATSRSVSWPNDRGQLNVALTSRVSNVSFRLKTEGRIIEPSAALYPGHLVVASTDGYLHCLQESNGRAIWHASIAERVRHKPFVIGDEVFVTTILGQLVKITHPLGQVQWRSPGIKAVIASNGKQLYCKGSDRELLVVDMASGNIVHRIFTDDFDFFYANTKTDRLLIGQKSGLLQCLRYSDFENPIFHNADAISEESETEETEIPETNEEGERNPFRIR